MSKRPQLDQHFDPQRIEKETYQRWETSGYFQPMGNGSPYSIAIPPPNVTGTLHVGHAFQNSIMDALIRYHRMEGLSTLWQPGTDHAGIATQMVVSEKLRSEGIKLSDLDRDSFVDRVWQWKEEAGGTITQQMRRLGSSVDWSRERFTMDEGFSRAVQEVFVRLYEEGLIYRGKRLVNWDPVMKTALSDLEVVSEEVNGHLWHLRYPFADDVTTSDGLSYVVVATTRPETMLGDTAVAVHPDDERYAQLIGQSVMLPLVGKEIPIIADDYVDREFGTGCLKITPAHDFNDNEVGTRHELPLVNIFTDEAKINENAPAKYRNLDRFDARKQIVEDLKNLGMLDRVEEYNVNLPRGERSNAILEPWMTDQWFVAIDALAKPAIEAVENGAIEFVPKRWENVYFNWMHNIKDWCISRQLWWGHQIPAWYDDSGEIYVGRSESEVRDKHNLPSYLALRRDPDVLETWFSSALWTFGTLGWPEKTAELQKFHPTDVLVTGHDIIFFWVARMIMMTLRFTGDVPFKKVYVTGLVLDKHGQKMTKTKGNGLDPIDVIEGIEIDDLVEKRTTNLTQPRMAERIAKDTRKDYPEGIPTYGTDALRFTFYSIASPSSSYNFDLQQVEGYHFFCNKLWNANRFVLGNLDADFKVQNCDDGLAELWIKSRLARVTKKVRKAMHDYRFDVFAHEIYQFAWHEFCDWYLEITKPVLFDESVSAELAISTRTTLVQVLETLTRLLHPLMPYITETIWQQLAPFCDISEKTIMLAEYPREDDFFINQDVESTMAWMQKVVTAVRNLRGERKTPPAKRVAIEISGFTTQDQDHFEFTQELIKELAKVSELRIVDGGDHQVGSTQVVDNLRVSLPFESAEERNSEIARLTKELERLEKDLNQSNVKLNNENFVSRAPAEVVQKERGRKETLESQLDVLQAQTALLQTDS